MPVCRAAMNEEQLVQAVQAGKKGGKKASEALDQKHVPVTCKLWDRKDRDEPGILMTTDGKRRLSAPVWEPDLDIDAALATE